MVLLSKPLPFLLPRSPLSPKTQPKSLWPARSKRMTAIIGMTGAGGGILCADSQETVQGYSKKSVDKVSVNLHHKPFRFSIGAAGPGHYCDFLVSELTSALLKVTDFRMASIVEVMRDVLLDFYPKHIWAKPSPERGDVETLTLIQDASGGPAELVHTCETAVNYIGNESYKTIGLGCHLADYLLDRFYSPFAGPEHLQLTAIHVLLEVIDNIDGCGKEPALIFFKMNGDWHSIWQEEINGAADHLDYFWEQFRIQFRHVTDVGENTQSAVSFEDIAKGTASSRVRFEAWYRQKMEREAEFQKRLARSAPKRA
jgi:hypothetical protein